MLEGSSPVIGLDHAQVTTPRSKEAEVKAFYAEVLGLVEIAKPAALVARGGAWFRCGEAALHLGVEDDATFYPQRKAHPALLVHDRETLAAIQKRLSSVGAPLQHDVPIPGYERFETRDPAGNRIEILCHITAEDESMRQVGDDAARQQAQTIKARVRETFGRAAEAYVASPGHAGGDDLRRLVELAEPKATEHALDVSTGGGHVALALAPYVASVTASDLTPRMLDAARTFLVARGVTNATFVVADAERLPFLDTSFDLVTVRIAPHHYVDVRAAVHEMARVLRPGGRLIVIDNIAPDDARLDALANEWEKRRDPSHVREYTAVEWRAFVAEAGLRITHIETGRKTHDFAPWVERVRMPVAERVALEHDMLAAPKDARAYFEIREEAGRVVSWTTDYVILRGERASHA
jgi:ubiquinone/menaquinone biosynthesis C-methylase UbiE/catechol 2,3-dioxygenase-like lactoylglutathione lyase family enzyme